MEIKTYKLKNANGLEAHILNFGGIIQSLKVPDADGNLEDIVLGFDDPSEYTKEHPYFGAIIGRYANRLAKGQFTLEGHRYELSKNHGQHTLHGGQKGFDKVFWDCEQHGQTLNLIYRSLDGDQGFPGHVVVNVTYHLSNENELIINYLAITDQDTILNLTNHSYFNLNPNEETILDHRLFINADTITEINEELIPTGKLIDITNGPFDFREPKLIGRDIHQVPGGYDHNFVLRTTGEKLREVARLQDERTRREIRVHTTQPGLQFYSGNFLDGSLRGKRAQRYGKHKGLCLETQHFPDSPNHANFPSVLLKAGEEFRSQTIYEFTLLP